MYLGMTATPDRSDGYKNSGRVSLTAYLGWQVFMPILGKIPSNAYIYDDVIGNRECIT